MAIPDTPQVQPKSAHVSDPSLAPFLQRSFDAADYLNATLQPLSLPSIRQPTSGPSTSLAQVSAQTQTLLSTLNAQSTRLSTTLTSMTDDILRSGGRLAYQVEVLRGETLGLTEAFSEGLKDEVKLFVPETPGKDDGKTVDDAAPQDGGEDLSLPPYIRQLKMLTRVRSRLEAVIKVFGDSMQWTLPPSEVSLTSSLISVSGPEAGSDSQSREDRGREFAENLRNEIADLVTGGGRDGDGFVAAMERIEALRDLSKVWKGTSEEKARIRFVDSLVKLAEERAKNLEKDPAKRSTISRGTSQSRQSNDHSTSTERSTGFLENLQKLRSNIYLE